MGCCGSDSTDEIPNFGQKQASNANIIQVEIKSVCSEKSSKT